MGAGLCGVTGIAWLYYFTSRAEKGVKKPIVLRLGAMAGGYVSALLGLLLFRQLEQMGIGVEWDRMAHGSLLPAFKTSVLIGAVEELSKLFPVLLAVRLSRSFDRPYEGLLFAACAGIGFSGAEGTLLWVHGELSWPELLARAAAAPLTHALFSIPWGLGLSAFLFWRRSFGLFLGLVASVLLHGTYDLMLASPQIPQIAAALSVLVLWLGFLRSLTPELSEVHTPNSPAGSNLRSLIART
jgi:RsiW-degrading membrane proteinase PrsW (M82 family)